MTWTQLLTRIWHNRRLLHAEMKHDDSVPGNKKYIIIFFILGSGGNLIRLSTEGYNLADAIDQAYELFNLIASDHVL